MELDGEQKVVESTTTETAESQQQQQQPQQQQQEFQLSSMKVTDQNSSLNTMIYIVFLAQKRGAFSLEESAKLWECIEIFKPKPTPTSTEMFYPPPDL